MKFVEIIIVDSKHHKLTVNPNTGRITVKIAAKGFLLTKDYVELVINKAKDAEFEPFTYRGRIEEHNGSLRCLLKTESGQHSVNLLEHSNEK